MKHRRTALALVTLGLVKTSVWQFTPPEIQADVWNVSCAVFTAVLVLWLGVLYFSPATAAAVVFLAVIEVQTAACSLAYIIKPWKTEPGDDLCSSGLGWPLAAVMAGMAMWLILILRDKNG